MNIAIIDLDFITSPASRPKIDVMQLSSYWKQKGATVQFYKSKFDLDTKNRYDKVYVFRDSESSVALPHSFADLNETKLMGKFYKKMGINDTIDIKGYEMARPDYSLYVDSTVKMYKEAVFLRFFTTSGYISKRQNPNRKVYTSEDRTVLYTVIDDPLFWRAPKRYIIEALKYLTTNEYKNIIFAQPINAAKLMDDAILKEFKKIRLAQGAHNTLVAAGIETYQEYKNLFEKISVLRLTTTKNIYINAYTKKHESYNDAIKEFIRVMKIVDAAKEYKVPIAVYTNKRRDWSLFYKYFELISLWTIKYPKISFIEFMCLPSMRYNKVNNALLNINNTRHHNTGRIIMLLGMLKKQPEFIKHFGTREWGDKHFNDAIQIYNYMERFYNMESNREKIKDESYCI